jgi:O-methyltransferase involved in polyketide biosynthesis
VTTERLRVDLSGAPQTMLATLYAKALDADFKEPILGDRFAKQIVERIDYDWAKTTITPRRAPSVTSRTAHFDGWANQFLAAHPHAVVVHVGCGLDSRFFRLQPGPGVEWYDVDYPEVAALRSQLYPAPERYHVIAASVTDPGWLAGIPADRPALMVGEGLTMYLTEQDGTALLRRVVGHFGSASCNSMRSTPSVSSRRCSTRWCVARDLPCAGRSTGPTTSSPRCPGCGYWPGSGGSSPRRSQNCRARPG